MAHTSLTHPTAASIAAAKATQQAERDAVFRASGLRCTDEPRRIPVVVVVIACTMPGCLKVRAGQDAAEAIAKLEQHLMAGHGLRAPREVA